jgi:hypothetical protein
MLTNEQMMAVLAAELKDQYGSVDLPVGVHTIGTRLTLDLQGSVIRGEDTDYTPTADISLLAVLARFAEKAGVVGPRLLDMLTAACLEAFEAGEPTGEYIEHTKAALRLVRERVTRKLPRKPRKGALRRAVKVDMVAHEPVELNAVG